jgi:hypothetical protein
MPIEISDRLAAAVLHQGRVDEAPHSFYRYPARFSPDFARAAVEEFTAPGDTVVDPFCGGGTAIIEAIRSGRRAVGCDLNALAIFLSKAKTLPISRRDQSVIKSWCRRIMRIHSFEADNFQGVGETTHYRKNLPYEALCFFGTITGKIEELPLPRQRDFARLALLSIGQSVIDCKTGHPSGAVMLKMYCDRVIQNLEAQESFLRSTAESLQSKRNQLNSQRLLLHSSAEEISKLVPQSWRNAKLVLTSPPYPGVHVLYHRWQVNGRRETPAAYWLANQKDGAGESFYTLGRRSEPLLKTYFSRLTKVFSSVRDIIAVDGIVVQLVAFSDPSWQLPAFLRAMSAAGFKEELQNSSSDVLSSNRLWRSVPGRKWYANRLGSSAASKEVLLIHRPVITKRET